MQRSSKPFFICLPKDNHDQYAGANITISGWGKTSPHALNDAAVLKSAFVRAMSDLECFESVKKLLNPKDDQLRLCFSKSGLLTIFGMQELFIMVYKKSYTIHNKKLVNH